MPTIVIYGETDFAVPRGVENAIERIERERPGTDTLTLPNTGHDYHGQEEALARHLTDWLTTCIVNTL